MIIECERCRSKFNLDDTLLKQGGSKVRCSVCKNVFKVYPPEPEPLAGTELEETVALDSPPVLADREEAGEDGIRGGELDQIPREAAAKPSLDEKVAPQAETPKGGAKDSQGLVPEDLDVQRIHEEEIRVDDRPQEKKTFRPFLVILILIVILLGGSAAVYLFAPQMLPDTLSFLKPPQRQELADTGVSRLAFANVKGGFVQSSKEGQLFVIQGVITNNYPKSRSFILVKGSLLDDKGQVVKTKMAYAGNTFTEEEIKSLPIEEINKELKNRSGRQGSNVGVKPETGVPFFIVIEGLPDNLSEFTVEAVSSSSEQQ
jgi:predicted Zn finger-like uncharacterized protein